MTQQYRILFIGNSHTYFNDLPLVTARLFEALHPGTQMVPVMIAHPGRLLEEHRWEPEVRFNVLHGHYDWVVLQQAAHPFPGLTSLLEDGGAIAEQARQAGAEPIAYMTWSELRYPEKQATMTHAYLEFGKAHQLRVCPVGAVWDAIRTQNPEIKLYDDDGEHASNTGSFLAACTFALLLSHTAQGSGNQAQEVDMPEDVLAHAGPAYGIPRHTAERIAACARATLCEMGLY